MPLETATYIDDLDPSNPLGTDGKSSGDDHLRLIKQVMQNTFANVTGAVTASHTEINHLVGVTSAVLHTSQLPALPGPIGGTTPVAGYFTTLQSNGVDAVVDSRTLTAGNGLTGLGDLSADRTVDVGAGTGITVAADSVGLDTSNTRNVDHAGVSVNVSGGLLSGGGTLAATRTITLTTETIQDLIGAMLSGNTETNITVTYQDTDGTIDFSVPGANTTTAGVVETATAAEVDAGSSTSVAVTPGVFGQTRSLASQGYYRLPGGLTLQWGTLSVGGNTSALETFSRAFTSIYSVVCSASATALNDGDNTGYVSSVSTTSFRIYNGVGSTYSFYWMAIGVS